MSNLYAYPQGGGQMTITGVQDGGFSSSNPLTISQDYPQFSGPSISPLTGGINPPGIDVSGTDWGNVLKWGVIGAAVIYAIYWASITMPAPRR